MTVREAELNEHIAALQYRVDDCHVALAAQTAMIDDRDLHIANLSRPLVVRAVRRFRCGSLSMGRRTAKRVVLSMRPTVKRAYYSRPVRIVRQRGPRPVRVRLDQVAARMQHVGVAPIDVRQRTTRPVQATNRFGVDEDFYASEVSTATDAALAHYQTTGVSRGARVYAGHLQAIEGAHGRRGAHGLRRPRSSSNCMNQVEAIAR